MLVFKYFFSVFEANCSIVLPNRWYWTLVRPWNTDWTGRLSTVNLLIKVACFVKMMINIFDIKMSLSKLVCTRRTAFPFSKGYLVWPKTESHYSQCSKIWCAIFIAWYLTKLCDKMFNLKDFERWIFHVVCEYNWPKGGQDIGGGGPGKVSQTVGSLFRTPCEKEKES